MVRDDYLKEKLLKEKYVELLNREEVYWHDKSRALWIAEGDHNIKLFHATSKGRRNKNKIATILDDGGILRSTEAELEQVALEHFVNILGNDYQARDTLDGRLSELVQKLVTVEEAKMLCEPYSLEEVKRATFELHPHKALRPDGMKVDFCQECLEFLGHDVWLVVEEFRKKGKGNPGQAGFGVVIQNKDGNVVSGTYGSIGRATNNEAEIRALEAGLLLCKEKGLTNVQIEGDSQIIVNGVTNGKFLN
ncbi:uncharacterized protein LOC131876189 [Cryptomeria japonica]|uniref:uncharacterized protein LOC131876189 n=1 Tax=Cryptomeria japonica TaxID=3369 RepID=UPI0027DA84BE|nr:uncharacterized protein LOC131876189 [Cryptomeria japonica]